MIARLTERLVARIEPGGRRVLVYDEDLRGFGLVVYKTGRKKYFVEYGPRGKRRRLTLGEWPMLAVGAARRNAVAVLAAVAEGRDPLEERRQDDAERAQTFQWWVERYLATVEGRKKRPDHDRSHLRRAVERWGDRPLADITPEDVRAAFEAERERAAASPRAVARDGTLPGATTANRWLASVRACFAAAWRAGHIRENPAARVRKYREAPPRGRVLSVEELRRLLAAVAEHPDPFVQAAFHLLVETGARLSEVLRARWADFDLDLEPPLWRIPSPKAGVPQVVPLAPRTAEMLRRMPRCGDYVIAGRFPDRPRYDLRGPWAELKRRAELPGDVVIHDIRRTFGLHVAQRAGLHVASKLLRHGDVRITERVYAPLGIQDLAAALERAGTPADVIPFPNEEDTANDQTS